MQGYRGFSIVGSYARSVPPSLFRQLWPESERSEGRETA